MGLAPLMEFVGARRVRGTRARLSRTVNDLKHIASWKLRVSPDLTIARGRLPPIGRPRNVTDPPVGGVNPEITLNRVVLPDPFGPSTPRISPSATSRLTPARAVTPPYCFLTSRASSRAGIRPPSVLLRPVGSRVPAERAAECLPPRRPAPSRLVVPASGPARSWP